ncbi:MAG: hypothetical protein ACT4NL_14400 [Pseudomarimonas sp.]
MSTPMFASLSEALQTCSAESGSAHFVAPAALQGGAQALASAFDSGAPAGVTRPTRATAEALGAAVGVTVAALSDADLSGVELYCLRRVDGRVEQVIVRSPVTQGAIDVDHGQWATDVLSAITKSLAPARSLLQAAVVGLPNGSVTAAANAAPGDGDPVDLFNQANQYTSRVIWTASVLDNNQQPLNCVFQLVTIGQAVWVKDASGHEYDYYFLVHYGVFSPNPGYFVNGSMAQGWYVTYYNLKTYPQDFLGNADMLMAQNSPGTTQGATTVSASVSRTTGISIGFFGDQLTATYSDSVTIGTSESYSIPDVTVVNGSNSQGNEAQWSFEMPYISGTDSLSAPVLMATSTFQPVCMMLWQASPSIRTAVAKASSPGVVFATELSIQFVYTYENGGSRQDLPYQPPVLKTTFPIPLPPTQKPPSAS